MFFELAVYFFIAPIKMRNFRNMFFIFLIMFFEFEK